MAEKKPATRSHEHEIEIGVPARVVWRALTEPKTLTRWYVEKADVEPRQGGRYRLSWGAEGDGEARIDVWEPNRRLRLVHLPFEGAPPMPDGCAIVEDFTLEEEDGTTLLRLVNSGIPETPEWDGFFTGTDSGWDGYFEFLRDMLEVGDDDETDLGIEEDDSARAPRASGAKQSGPRPPDAGRRRRQDGGARPHRPPRRQTDRFSP